MRVSFPTIAAISGLMLMAVAAGAQADASAAIVVPLSTTESAVAIHDAQVDASGIRGTIVNHSGKSISDLELSVSYAWLWRNERAPGSDNPGWAEHHVLPVRLAPDASTSFSLPRTRALPDRADGRIVPRVRVIGYTEYKR